jgi:hypothetical protein
MTATDAMVTEITVTQEIAAGRPWADDHPACARAMATACIYGSYRQARPSSQTIEASLPYVRVLAGSLGGMIRPLASRAQQS